MRSFSEITKDESRDAGMALVLVLLFIFLARKRETVLIAAVAVHVLNMVQPHLYRPIAFLWRILAEPLGAISAKVLLSIAFFGVLTPVGLLMRLFGRDSLKLRAFRADEGSAMWKRNHKFVAQDLERPF